MQKRNTRGIRLYVLTSKTNVYTFVIYGALSPNPQFEKRKEQKLKEDVKEFVVPIRMNFAEREMIKKRAQKTGKPVSTFIKDSAMGCEIKEKPDKDFYDSIIKPMGKFMRTLSELERLLYHENFIDERILKKEIEDWRKFRMTILEKYL